MSSRNEKILTSRVFWIIVMLAMIVIVEPFETERDRIYQQKQECIERSERTWGPGWGDDDCSHYDAWAARASNYPGIIEFLISFSWLIFIINPDFAVEVFGSQEESK